MAAFVLKLWKILGQSLAQIYLTGGDRAYLERHFVELKRSETWVTVCRKYGGGLFGLGGGVGGSVGGTLGSLVGNALAL